jgi:hypothetical protein
MAPRPVSITYLDGLRLSVRFDDGAEGDVDFARFMKFPGLLAQLRDPAYFARAFIHPEAHVITWPNGMDVCNTVLYSKVTGRSIRSLLNPAPRAPRRAKPRRRLAAR